MNKTYIKELIELINVKYATQISFDVIFHLLFQMKLRHISMDAHEN